MFILVSTSLDAGQTGIHRSQGTSWNKRVEFAYLSEPHGKTDWAKLSGALFFQTVHTGWEPLQLLVRWSPRSYRRTYNRPTYVGGMVAHWIAPSSQEAASWCREKQRGSYRRKATRHEALHFYPKPWEVLNVGQQKRSNKTDLEKQTTRVKK